MLAAGSIAQTGQPLQTFDRDSLTTPLGNFRLQYAGLENININKSLSLPILTVYIQTDENISRDDFYTPPESQSILSFIPDEYIAFEDIPTGTFNRPIDTPRHNRSILSAPVHDIQYMIIDGIRYAAVSLLPVTLSDNNTLVFNSAVYLRDNINVGPAKRREDIIEVYAQSIVSPLTNNAAKSNSDFGVPLGYEYIIITSPALKPSFAKLAEYKNSCGITTAIAVIDSIFLHYSGIDDAEKVREYLKDFYSAGGQYALLGGDDAVLPVRYLFYYNTDVPPANPYMLHPSDLYFADLDGDWDADGDGIWGEPSDDFPDITPELIVGRLPVRNPAAIENYIDKLIEYETNPGGGDFDYLTRSLFFSSDEMRDYPAGGQHGVIAGALPSYMAVDTVNGVELPSGDHPEPTNADGYAGINTISGGSGFIHIISHGRTDGFIVKSANYGDWPASFILTTPQENNGHGSLVDLEQNNKVSLYYSLACDNGAFDLDSINGESGDWSLVEGLIAAPASGAVGMVANTRWGWVYSSYFLQESFTANLYGAAEGSPAMAMYYSWVEYPYYRDLIYGQNYYGDPTLKIYTDTPSRTNIAVEQETNGIMLNVSADNQSIPEANVTISVDGMIIEEGLTDDNGEYLMMSPQDDDLVYTITAGHAGGTIALEQFTPSISLDIDDDDLLPQSFELMQNYPNPFNPATTIRYQLPHMSEVSLDIFNVLGQLVKSIDIPDQSAGYHTIIWDGTDQYNQPIASGVYFYRMTAGDFCRTRKMYMIR